ncbi:MAG: hypothetical protein R3D58_10915 [Saprospiraceae bacterium]
MKKMRFLLPCIAFFLFFQQTIYAQSAKLGIQGILKKSNGNAVDDDTYQLTFKLYNVATGGSALWQETQDDVEVTSGIYTATLGTVNPLSIPFDETYYLGVTVGASSGAEMLPRIQLTTAPYALSLIGQSNQFPSSGIVKADNEIIAGKLTVGQANLHATNHAIMAIGGMLARGGAPGGSGGSNNGYAFAGNGGDNDSGLFSTADGQVSLYTNNAERLKATTTGVEITGNLTSTTTVLTVNDNLNLTTGNTLQYNGLSDWRLVDRDDFLSGSLDGWGGTTALNNSTTATIENVTLGTFNGNSIRPTTSNTHCLKKTFNLASAGSYSFVKIKFKYYYIDSWDSDDTAIGGFATSTNGTNANICWMNSAGVYSTAGANPANYTGSTSYSDGACIGEMVAATSSTSFVVFFGMRGDSGISDERYGIGNIEVWVR